MHNRGMTPESIKAARTKLGETQAAFAERFGVDQATIHRWETKGLPEHGAAPKAVEAVLRDLEAPPTETSPADLEA